ncbi:MAG: dihydroorotase [Saprospiraceae bacterium]|nr:dihydroorotase [Saprospiraceae bacterium]
MRLLIQRARIVQDGQVSEPMDVLVEDGLIRRIGSALQPTSGTTVWSSPGLCVSTGWLDVGTQMGDPGLEHREDLYTAQQAAAAGGFTAIAPYPNTSPAIHAKSEVLYLLSKSRQHAVTVYPIGAVSVQTAGRDLAELYDMHSAGAVAFADGPGGIHDAGLLLRALQYAQAFRGVILDQPMDGALMHGGQMHEGLLSTRMGLRGIPSLAESIAVQRDLSLMRYAGGRLHLYGISTAEGVALIRQAKAEGLAVTASATIANACFTDQQLAAFDTNWKLMPPLRSASDRQAVVAGLADGTLDFLTSNHTPLDEEVKNVEFTYADFGMTALETALSLSCMHLAPELGLARLAQLWSVAPRRTLGMAVLEIREGARAELTVFDPDRTWVPETGSLYSRSRNTPFLGATLRGRAVGIVGNGQWWAA